MAKIAPNKETKDVAIIPVLEITPAEGMPIDGNFGEILLYLQKREKEISKMKLTEDNIEQVKLIKKEATAYRTKMKDKVDSAVKLLFDSPKAILKSKAQEVFTAISNIEGVADGVLDKLEADRVSDLTKVLDAYRDSFQEKYALDGEKYLPRIEYKKEYYNKTQKEKDSKDDLEAQFQALKKEQDAYSANLRLIKTMCKDEPRLNVVHWIDQLAHDDVATIAEKISAEKQRLAELDKAESQDKPEEPEAENAPDEKTRDENETKKVILGILPTLDFSTDFPGKMAYKDFRLKYPVDTADALTDLFEALRAFGITTSAIKQKETVF